LNFEDFWNKGIDFLQSKITDADPGLVIDNWRVDKGNSGERFPIVGAGPDEIKCLSIYASKRIGLPQEDMEILFEMWDGYLAGEIKRMDLIDNIPRPAYCVSVMKLLKDNVS
jgi:hypothetical protein